MAKSKSADYNSMFAKNLRNLLGEHPKTGEKTTYNTLGEVLGVKPQSVSQWANGDTTPDMKHIIPICKYFDVDANYLLTGVSAENETIWKDLGLHENSIRELKRLKGHSDKGEVHSTAMLLIIDLLLRSDGLLRFYDMLNHYVYDVLEHNERIDADKAALEAAVIDPERQNDTVLINRLVQRVKSNEANLELLWYKASCNARDVMLTMVEKFGGFENMEKYMFNYNGRLEKWDTTFWNDDELPEGTLLVGEDA